MTAEHNPEHYHLLTHDSNTLTRRLFQHARVPWEGDNITLKADLVNLSRKWTELNCSAPCPVYFSDTESPKCLRLERALCEADDQLRACREAIGVGYEGWVPTEHYEDARRCERKLKADALEAAETDEERKRIQEHWIFDDFCEGEYM